MLDAGAYQTVAILT